MRVVLVLLAMTLGLVLSEPDIRQVYLPAAARDPSSRRYLPVGRGRTRPRVPAQSPRRPFPGGGAPQSRDDRADVPTTLTPDARFAQYQPSSAEVPPNLPPLSYQQPNTEAPAFQPFSADAARPPAQKYLPADSKASRRYLPVAAPGGGSSSRGGGSHLLPHSGGSHHEPDYPPANYDFEYNVLDEESGNDFGHREGRRGDQVTGMYHVVLADGRTQLVEYVADLRGYRPVVSYQGTAKPGGSQGYSSNKPTSPAGGYNYDRPSSRS